METVAKFLIYLTVGVALLACNVLYLRTAMQSITGGDLVVAPVKVIGAPGDASLAGEALARLVIVRLQMLEWELQQSQSSLQQADRSGKSSADTAQPETTLASPRGVTAGILGTPKIAALNAQLFEPTNIEVKVAGVEVGGLLPRIQGWFVQHRALTFSVSWEGKSAIIAGNIDALGLPKSKPLWMSIENPTMNSIADGIALALIQRMWSRDSQEFSELEDTEFNKLVASINEVARINRRVITYNVAAKADFERVLATVSPLADRISGWGELTYFVASVAESAEDYERALTLYRRMASFRKQPLSPESLAARIAKLETQTRVAAGTSTQAPLQKLQAAVADATRILNALVNLSLPEPPLEILSDEVLNAYWDGRKLHIPLAAQDIPDIVYHEVAWPFIQKIWAFKYGGESGSLAQSYTDVLTSFVKQKVLGQTASDADWVIAPGAIAWMKGDIKAIGEDRRPLRSLKAPGTAFDDPILGKDPQPDHFSKLVVVPGDGGVHVNSGIPNRAFYETAIRIGTEQASKIWVASLDQLKPGVSLRGGARVIYDTAVKLYGKNSAEANSVKAGWSAVGLSL